VSACCKGVKKVLKTPPQRVIAVFLAWSMAVVLQTVVGASPVVPQNDPRLAKNYTFYFPPTPLAELLQSVSRETGVNVRSERSIAQHRAILVVHDRPLHETLTRLAEAFGYAWRKVESKDKPPEYMLYQSSQAFAQQQAEVRHIREMYLRALRDAVREWATRQPADLDAIQKEVGSEWRETVHDGKRPRSQLEIQRTLKLFTQLQLTQTLGTWAVGYTLSRLTPQQWKALEAGEVFVLDSSRADSTLPPELLELYRQHEPHPLLPGIRDDLRNQQQQLPGEEVAKQRAADRLVLVFGLHPTSGRLYYQVLVLAGAEVATFGGKAATGALWEYAKTLGESSAGDGSSLAESEALLVKLFEKTPQPVPLPPTALMDVTGHVLALYARENHRDLVGEWYPQLPREQADTGESRVEIFRVVGLGEGDRVLAPSRSLEAGEVAFGNVKLLSAALDARTVKGNLRENGYVVRESDGWLVVTQRYRAWCRQYEVPEASIRKWLFKPGQEAQLDISDLIEIARLTPEQIERLALKHRNLPQTEGMTASFLSLAHNPARQSLFLALGSAAPAHRQTLLQGTPVRVSALAPAAQRYLRYSLAWRASSPIPGGPEQWEFAVQVQRQVRDRIEWSKLPSDLSDSLWRHESPEEWLARQPEAVRKLFTRSELVFTVSFVLRTPEGEHLLQEWSLRYPMGAENAR
jgi:hypothetical protein